MTDHICAACERLGADIGLLRLELERVKAENATAVAYQFGKVRATKRAAGWVVVTTSDEIFDNRGVWFYEPTMPTDAAPRTIFTREKAIDLAKAQSTKKH